jgi:A/G-specific adenine glycosylase
MAWISRFQTYIWAYYKQRGRQFFWRHNSDPYVVFLSEIMLQQTQTSRIEVKLPEFLREFPTLSSLARASLPQVLSLWVGLGYNRRAVNLHRTARILHDQYESKIPEDSQLLLQLPGIGPYTSGSIPTFAYNLPRVFIETNIRRVFLHHFTDPTQHAIGDQEILGLIEETLDHSNPRDWYYALMDYGAELKTLLVNPNRRSKTYTKQSAFEGSNRQIRGAVIQILSQEGGMLHQEQLQLHVNKLTKRFIAAEELSSVLLDLSVEGFVCKDADEPWYGLAP